MFFEALTLMGLHELNSLFNIRVGKSNADEYGIYIDGNGDTRLKSNGKKVVRTVNENGEDVIKYVDSGAIAVNISKNKSIERKDKAKEDNEEFYLYWIDNGHNHYSNINIKGDRYAPTTSSNMLYVKRRVIYECLDLYKPYNITHYLGDYYMDMTYKFYKPTIETINNDSKIYNNSQEIEEYIMNILKDRMEYLLSINNKFLLPNNTRPIYIGNASDYYFTNKRLVNTR